MYEYQAALIRVIDADTFEFNIDLGFYTHVYEKVRLRGVNAPERFTPDGKFATDFVKRWFFDNNDLTLKTYKTDLTDKYGRWVADVRSGNGHNLADMMLLAGVAVPFLP
jgi:micrococcal nuclease